MREFFQGWRRKVGCVVLVVASILGVAWGRSYFVEDHLWIAFSKRRALAIHSALDHIAISDEWQEENGTLAVTVSGVPMCEVRFDSSKICDWVAYPAEYQGDNPWGVTDWYWGAEGLGYGGWGDSLLGFRMVVIPYWLPILSLSLISAYLLLWPQRKLLKSETPKKYHGAS